jgi:hypothetical protein
MTINPSDTPVSTGTTGLRATVYSRVIECQFEVTDHVLRSLPDVVGGSFRPRTVAVRINLDNGCYWVDLAGPRWDGSYRETVGTGHALLHGKDYTDVATDHHIGLVTDAVVETLREHGVLPR